MCFTSPARAIRPAYLLLDLIILTTSDKDQTSSDSSLVVFIHVHLLVLK
jgi:hypothetical protein